MSMITLSLVRILGLYGSIYMDSKVTKLYACFRVTLMEQSHHSISPADMKTSFLSGVLNILHYCSDSFTFSSFGDDKQILNIIYSGGKKTQNSKVNIISFVGVRGRTRFKKFN